MNGDRRADEIGKRSETKRMEWSGRPMLQWALALASAFLIPAYAAADGSSADRGVAAPLHRHYSGSSLEDRVNMLSKALDLDARQQSELRKLLLSQREQVERVWSETSVPAVYRVIATQAISDRTADQIRELLNDEQKKKYNPPRPPHEATSGADRPNVEMWMNAVQPK